jgi:hypothetical protein
MEKEGHFGPAACSIEGLLFGAEQLGIETPVLNVMAEFCEGHIGAHDVISYLMSLPLKDEF